MKIIKNRKTKLSLVTLLITFLMLTITLVFAVYEPTYREKEISMISFDLGYSVIKVLSLFGVILLVGYGINKYFAPDRTKG